MCLFQSDDDDDSPAVEDISNQVTITETGDDEIMATKNDVIHEQAEIKIEEKVTSSDDLSSSVSNDYCTSDQCVFEPVNNSGKVRNTLYTFSASRY